MFKKTLLLLFAVSTVTFSLSAQSTEGEPADSSVITGREDMFAFSPVRHYDDQLTMRLSWQFARAVLSGDTNTMKLLMTPDAQIGAVQNIFYDRLEFLILTGLWRTMEGTAVDGSAGFDSVAVSYEFLETGSDSSNYLTMEVRKTEDGWKVASYGFDK
jgi:hypothetical protein